MHLAFAFFADAAQVFPDGRMFVLSGGIELLQGQFPLRRPALALLVKLLLRPEECARVHLFRVDVVLPNGQPLGSGTDLAFGPLESRPNRTTSLTVKIAIRGLVFPMPGEYSFRMSVDNEPVGVAPLELVEAQPSERVQT